jgi:histidinol-phosphatase
LIALEVDGELVAGVVSAPALGSRWSGARGLGAQRDGEAVSVSKVARLEDAHLAYDSVDAFESVGLDTEFLALARRCWRVRGFGDFWGHMLVADGSIDVAVEVGGLAVWDIAAVKVVVEQAGGRCTDLRGEARIDTGDVISTNGLLHDDVVAAFTHA